MTTGALIISWGRVVPGREKKALEVFASTQEYWEGNEKRGEIVSHRPFFGPLRGATGMFLIEGETERLQALMRTDEFRKEIQCGTAVVEDLHVDLVEGGSEAAVQRLMAVYAEANAELGYL